MIEAKRTDNLICMIHEVHHYLMAKTISENKAGNNVTFDCIVSQQAVSCPEES